MDIYTNSLTEERSTYEQRQSNARVLYSVVMDTIVPRLDWGIEKHGVKIVGTFDKSPYMTMGTGRLYINAYEELVKVENYLLIVMSQVKLLGVIDYFDITKVLDGFYVDFVWNLV